MAKSEDEILNDSAIQLVVSAGIPVDRVRVVLGDSSLLPGPTSGGSTATATVLPAIGQDKLFVRNAVSGQPLLLTDGQLNNGLDSVELNPRTAVGIDRSGTRMIWLVVDGRQPRFSEGVTFRQLAELLQEFGAWDALALDGGGSSTLATRKANGEVKVLNCPIHGKHPPGVERPVANCLGVRVKNE